METFVLSSESVFLSLMLQSIVYFPAGFLLLHSKLKSYPFLVALPLYIACGLFMDTILLSVLGIFYIGSVGLIVITYFFYAIILLRRSLKALCTDIKQQIFKMKFVDALTLTVFIIVFVGFSLLAGFMEWPQTFEAINHGLLTSTLVHNHKVGFNLALFEPPQPFFEPFGFHLMSGTLSQLLNVYPGQSVLVFSTFIQVLIVLLAYSVVFMLTRSAEFSILALASAFYFYPAIQGDFSLMGLYYSGNWPAVFGQLGLLLFLGCISILDPLKTVRSYLIIFVPIIGTGLSYPSFILIPILFLIVIEIRKYVSLIKGKNKPAYVQVSVHGKDSIHDDKDEGLTSKPGDRRNKNFLTPRKLAVIIPLVGVLLFIVGHQIQSLSDGDIWPFNSKLPAYPYQMTTVEFTKDVTTLILVLFTMILAADSLIRNTHINMSIFYLLISGVGLLASREINALSNLWFFLPSLLYPFLVLFSWIALATFINDKWAFIDRLLGQKFLIRSSKIKRNKILQKVLLRVPKMALCTVLMLFFFLTPIIDDVTLVNAKYWGYPNSELTNDLPLLIWLSQNTNSSDVIMNDYSKEGTAVNLLSLKNTTVNYWPESEEDITRSKLSQIAWIRPGEFLEDFIKRYDVKYIFVPSDPIFYNPTMDYKIWDNLISLKNTTSPQYKNLYNSFPFLENVKETGSGAVYKVVQGQFDQEARS